MAFSRLVRLKLPLLQRTSSCLTSNVRLIHGVRKPTDEYTKEPEYPEIEPYRNKDEKELAILTSTLKNMKTVEEKQMYLNKPKYYGWYTCVINNKAIRYDSKDMFQYITNTTVVDNALPDQYGEEVELDKLASQEAEKLEPLVKSYLSAQTTHYEHELDVLNDRIPYRESHALLDTFKLGKKVKINSLVSGLHRLIVNHLSSKGHEHVLLSSTDVTPRNEAFWFRGGILPDRMMISKRKGTVEHQKKKHYPKDQQHDEETFVYQKEDRCVQYEGFNVLQMRSQKTLEPFVGRENQVCTQGHVPVWNYPLQESGYPNYCQHGTNLPGNWTGTKAQFVNLSYVNAFNYNEHLTNQNRWIEGSEWDDREDMLLCKSIMASFGVLLPIACYLGFSPLNDPTTSFSTQTVVTDGQNFKFSVYQLNKTALLDVDSDDEKTLRNVCWHLPVQKLYDSIDEKSGQIEGFNRDVLTTLLKFYLLEPTVALSDIDNSEYLARHRYVHNIRDDYDREYTHAAHRHVFSKRAKHLPKPDIEMWQKIFMIDHPDQTFALGLREKPWFRMAQVDFRGREHWHPEFRELDYYRSAYKPRKYKKFTGDHRVKKVTAPIPNQEGLEDED